MNGVFRRPIAILMTVLYWVVCLLTVRVWAFPDDPAATAEDDPIVSQQDRQFWSFRPLVRPPVPAVAAASSVRTPIDAFLLAKLEQQGLNFSPHAERPTLLRRVYLDLIGLPPSPAELRDFLADQRPDAFERVVDRLLASPHFGERWGRHWLDVAGYVDTVGFDTDATNIILSDGKWRYRDWVINALNHDLPYDRFIVEQLAGDELHDWRRAEKFTPEIRESLIATGFLRTARDYTHEDVGVIPQNFYNIAHDTIEIVGTGLLGLTVQCSRCHSHKFDPLPQEDYYRLMAIFSPAYNPHDWRAVLPYDKNVRDRSLPDVSAAEQAEIEAHNRVIDGQIKQIRERLETVQAPYREQLRDERLATLPEPIRADVRDAVATPADKRTEIQKYLAGKFESLLAISAEQIAAILSDPDRAQSAEIETQLKMAESQRRSWGKIQALWDVGPAPATHLFIRGEFENPGAETQPGFFRVLCKSDADAVPSIPEALYQSSGRRLTLAHWLTKSGTPAAGLLARVQVNRVWKNLFGRGIVASPENFGTQGDPPSHPELLEWLGSEFAENGWHVKSLIRTLVTSTAYRQASYRSTVAPPGADPFQIDPDNRLWSRMPLKRLEGEVVRDCILSVSGQLNPAQFGPPILTDAKPNGSVVVAKEKLANPSDAFRRSIYLVARRSYHLTLLTVFDQPQVATNCLCRDASAVPLQSLTMLNDAFQQEQARQFAQRLRGEVEPVASNLIRHGFEIALSRTPTQAESNACREFLLAQQGLFEANGCNRESAEMEALAQLCLVILNSSEFLYAE